MDSVNWQQIATDLSAKFHSDQGVANRAGCSRSTILNMRHGRVNETWYSVGSRLVELHNRYCKQ